MTTRTTATNFTTLLGADYRNKLSDVKIASIGPITTATLRELGLEPTVQAERSGRSSGHEEHPSEGERGAVRARRVGGAQPGRQLLQELALLVGRQPGEHGPQRGPPHRGGRA